MKRLLFGLLAALLVLTLTACPPTPTPVVKDFSLSANSLTIAIGQSETTTITITRTGGFADLVALSLNGQPAGVTSAFNPASADTTSVLTLNVDNTVVAGNYPLTVTGTAGTKTHNSPAFTLTVKKVVDNGAFELAATAVTITKDSVVANNIEPQIIPTPSANSTITITRKNAFAGAVNLTVQGLPTGVTHTFTPNPVSGNTSILKLSVAASAPTGSHAITVKGTSGAKTATTVFNLTIKDKVDTTKPSIVSVSPINGAKGIKANANVVITFSEVMDKAATQAAYQSPDIGPVTITWTNAGRTMNVNPNNDLKYSANAAYKYYNYAITTAAKDLAGNTLAANKNVKFSTYRTFYKKVYAQKTLDGYVYNTGTVYKDLGFIAIGDISNNKYRRGFLSFYMGTFPSNTLKIKKATLGAYQYSKTGFPYLNLKKWIGGTIGYWAYLRIYHVNYGSSLTSSDFNRAPLSTTSYKGFDKSYSSPEWVKKDVSNWVQNDLDNYNARRGRSQYRLQFEKNTDNDNATDSVRFYSSDYGTVSKRPYLEIWFYAP